MHSLIFVSHCRPSKPSGQLHKKPNIAFEQVPPFMQGDAAQKSTRVSHSVPVKMTVQEQVKPDVPSGTHTPEFIHGLIGPQGSGEGGWVGGWGSH